MYKRCYLTNVKRIRYPSPGDRYVPLVSGDVPLVSGDVPFGYSSGANPKGDASVPQGYRVVCLSAACPLLSVYRPCPPMAESHGNRGR